MISRVSPLGAFLANAVVKLLGGLPQPWVERLAFALARMAWVLGIRRRVTLDNLRHAYPELPDPERQRIALNAYRHMALAAVEALRAVHLAEEEIEGAVELVNPEAFQKALSEGKGVLIATAHFGSWERLGSVMARRGIPISAVVRPLSGALNARIMEARVKNGLSLIPPKGAVMASTKALRAGSAVVMLVDQVLPARHGVFVPFFGRPACTNPSLAITARRSQAPVFLVMGVRQPEGKVRLCFEGPFPVPETGNPEADVQSHTSRITAEIERFIRAHPEQWLWMHRRWKVQPSLK